ncbi:chondroadherin [Falco naumanni]|uniref:Chondroadherin n=1 Tax=Falco tinnunculus TaxID=100819 RepID=A0A8C4U9R1_FALTI|nr:chondroadherin [Falco naumanni]XP_040437723.1 chondroadherin [Falco naumanni]
MNRSGFFLSVLSLLACLASIVQACPPSCHCHGGDLQHVICDNAGLKKIPKVPEQTRLLNLQKNNFPVLPTNGFRDLKKLVSLHLQSSRIKEISTGAFRGLKSLVYLYLTDNQISVIKPGAFDDLSELTYLYLDQNKIPDLPKGLLSPLVNLFILHLGSNKIRELKPGVFNGAKDLRWLFLSDNSLTNLLPGALEDVENLAVLHLDKNQLSSYPVSAMSKLRVLEELKLSHNPIEVIPDNAFQSFGRYLQTLNLDNMKLKKFADNAFAGVTALKTAHLENNRLTQLPRNFPFDKLETLTLSRNAWHCNCQLAHLRKWLKGNRTRTEDTCSTPVQYRGQSIRDTPALRTCKLPTKRSKKGSRH